MDADTRARVEAALQRRLDFWNRGIAIVSTGPAELPMMTRERKAAALALAFAQRRLNSIDDVMGYLEVERERDTRTRTAATHAHAVGSRFRAGHRRRRKVTGDAVRSRTRCRMRLCASTAEAMAKA
jgi:hypothetical protein